MFNEKTKEQVNIEPEEIVNDEAEVKAKIKTLMEAKLTEPEMAEKVRTDESEKALTIEKIKAVLEAEGDVLDQAAENIAPGFDYEKAAEELDLEEAAEELFGVAVQSAEPEFVMPAAMVSPSKYPKERREVKTKIGKWALKDRHRMVLCATILAIVGVAAWQGIDYAIPETVDVTYQTVSDIREEKVSTRARTVGEFEDELIAAGYDISEQDAVFPMKEMPVSDKMTVKIMKATESKARIAGKEQDFLMIAGTVEENLLFNSIAFDDDDVIKPALNKTVGEKTKIVVDEVHYKTKEKTEKVEATSRVILDPKLTSGVEQRTEGNDGKGVFKYKYKYVNGKKTKTTRKVKEWITEPHDNLLRLGTASTGQSGEYIVVRTFTANCTAYTARPGAGGALGEGVHVGTCAVDPTFVPYRSQMWISGYGYAYANDCGGAVKGNIVDLFMNSTSQCISWGRRNETAYILQPVK